MKDMNDIAIIVQARLNSQRLPKKMLKKFSDSNLFEILLNKLDKSKLIDNKNVYLSIHEKELKEIASKYDFNIYERSYESANNDNDIKVIYEWYKFIDKKYGVLISACNPLMKIKTIENFIINFTETKKEGSLAVFEKNTYYWDKNKQPITDWKSLKIMNTKAVDCVYEAGHCLYASRINYLQDGNWMDNKTPPEPNLFVMEEIEAFDIDYQWQFDIAEKLYEELRFE